MAEASPGVGQRMTSEERGVPSGAGSEMRLYETTRELDAEEGAAINSMKATHVEPFPEPTITVPDELRRSAMVTSVDYILNWARKCSVYPLSFGTACCVFEMVAAATAHFDISRFGSEVMRASPRQADLMIVAGTITWKMAPAVRLLYEQMAEPKWVMAMGACSISGGPFYDSYAVVPGVNRIVPVDVYVPGCPPRPDALLYGLTELHRKIRRYSLTGTAAGHG